ncbi:hypothetical protein CJF26_21530, partial [Photobacterium phosphoreum]|nr:hypothetical protein [Photobacterium phosphoreum]
GLANGHPGGGRAKPASKGRKPAGGARTTRADAAPTTDSGSRRRSPDARPGNKAATPKPARGSSSGRAKTAAPAPRSRTSSPKAGPKGDDWQPRGASAHESHLGKLGGRK